MSPTRARARPGLEPVGNPVDDLKYGDLAAVDAALVLFLRTRGLKVSFSLFHQPIDEMIGACEVALAGRVTVKVKAKRLGYERAQRI